jgi:hypothetical protein
LRFALKETLAKVRWGSLSDPVVQGAAPNVWMGDGGHGLFRPQARSMRVENGRGAAVRRAVGGLNSGRRQTLGLALRKLILLGLSLADAGSESGIRAATQSRPRELWRSRPRESWPALQRQSTGVFTYSLPDESRQSRTPKRDIGWEFLYRDPPDLSGPLVAKRKQRERRKVQ